MKKRLLILLLILSSCGSYISTVGSYVDTTPRYDFNVGIPYYYWLYNPSIFYNPYYRADIWRFQIDNNYFYYPRLNNRGNLRPRPIRKRIEMPVQPSRPVRTRGYRGESTRVIPNTPTRNRVNRTPVSRPERTKVPTRTNLNKQDYKGEAENLSE